MLLECKVKPPYIPPLSGEGDTSHFEQYQEDVPYGIPQPDPYGKYFKEF